MMMSDAQTKPYLMNWPEIGTWIGIRSDGSALCIARGRVRTSSSYGTADAHCAFRNGHYVASCDMQT